MTNHQLISPERSEKTQINKIRNEREVTNDTTEIQRIIIDYYEQPYAKKKMDSLEKTDKLLERNSLPRLN